ncbi:glycosyltransferase family protein [Actinophytocola sediminis]
MSTSPSDLLIYDERPGPAGFSRSPYWRIAQDDGATLPTSTPRIQLAALEETPLDAAEITSYTDTLVRHLEREHGADAVTPGGVSWLRVHAVPVRRLVNQAVRKLLALSNWLPFATSPGPLVTGVDSRLVETRDNAVLGYHSYTAAWAGIAFLLADSPSAQALHIEENPSDVVVAPDVAAGLVTAAADVVAVSWSSRHAQTLLPVLEILAARGTSSLVVDCASELDQRVPTVLTATSGQRITVSRVPAHVFEETGGLAISGAADWRSGRTLSVGVCRIDLGRLASLVSRTVLRSTDCTQPSWAAACRLEQMLDRVFAVARPAVLLCSNDTSPVGVLAVGAADRAGANTVYVQHGAWVSGQVTGRAEHCGHIAVMGTRDVPVARRWARRADAEVHVVGQPRFDPLAGVDKTRQRQYLSDLLAAHGRVPDQLLVWACQPVSARRLRAQFDVLVEGVRQAISDWGLVIAPHPVQSEETFASLLADASRVPVGVVASEVGARGCLGGAHAVVSASSTCGIEALLLDVPVLELALPGNRTLELAEQHAARRCTNGTDVAVALDQLGGRGTVVKVPESAKDAVCRTPGRSAESVADLVAACTTNRARPTRRPHQSTTTFPGESLR